MEWRLHSDRAWGGESFFLDSGANPRGDLSPSSLPGSTGEAASSLPAAADLLLNAMLLFPQAWVTSILPVTSLPLPTNPPHPRPVSVLNVKRRVPGRPAKAFSGPVHSQGAVQSVESRQADTRGSLTLPPGSEHLRPPSSPPAPCEPRKTGLSCCPHHPKLLFKQLGETLFRQLGKGSCSQTGSSNCIVLPSGRFPECGGWRGSLGP